MRVLSSALALAAALTAASSLSVTAAQAQDSSTPAASETAAADATTPDIWIDEDDAADTIAPDTLTDEDEADEERRRQIIVQGERPLSRQEIAKGVDQLARRSGMFDPVPRFADPVCVFVIGLGEKLDSLVAERIRSNVAAVGLQVGGEKCRPNAFAIIGNDPRAIYAKVRQTRPDLVGIGFALDRIIDLREYSKSQLELRLKSGAPAVSWSTYAPQSDGPVQLADLPAGGAFWGWNQIPALLRGARARGNAVVVFDAKQLTGVRLHQLADYATLHLLGSPRLSPDTTAAGVPTILSLFDQDPSLAPQRLTTFDRAYLCGIYRMREGSLGTRMVQNMLDVYDSECVRVGAPEE